MIMGKKENEYSKLSLPELNMEPSLKANNLKVKKKDLNPACPKVQEKKQATKKTGKKKKQKETFSMAPEYFLRSTSERLLENRIFVFLLLPSINSTTH
jgi:hypothetical protein